MLLAFLIYNDGIGTIIRMATLYGEQIGIDTNAMIASVMIIQFVGIPCAFAFGALAGKIGAKASIVIGLMVYVGISVLGLFHDDVHALLDAGGPRRHRARRNAGAEPLAVLADDPARPRGRVFRVLRRGGEVCRDCRPASRLDSASVSPATFAMRSSP